MPTAQCRPVWGSGVQCAVQTWNQSSSRAISSIKMNSFVQKPWPGSSSGPPDQLLVLRPSFHHQGLLLPALALIGVWDKILLLLERWSQHFK